MRDRNERALFAKLLDDLIAATNRYTGDRESVQRAYWHALSPFPWKVVQLALTLSIQNDHEMPDAAALRSRCRELGGEGKRRLAELPVTLGAEAARRSTLYLQQQRPFVVVADDDNPQGPANAYPWSEAQAARHRTFCVRPDEWWKPSSARGLEVPPCLHWNETGMQNCTLEQLQACYYANARAQGYGRRMP